MSREKVAKKDYSWVGSATSLLAVATCYGTLAAVSLLSVIGINVKIEEDMMVKLVSGLLALALAGMAYSYRVHKHLGPLVLSVASAILLSWVFYGTYSKPLEMTGFAMLIVASIWDFRAKKRACTAACRQSIERGCNDAEGR